MKERPNAKGLVSAVATLTNIFLIFIYFHARSYELAMSLLLLLHVESLVAAGLLAATCEI